MDQKALKLKLFIIFLLPALALIYFSFTFVSDQNKQLKSSVAHKLSTNITHTITELIHSLQIERGLHAGYITAQETSKIDEVRLQERYKTTDQAYQKLLNIIRSNSEEKKELKKNVASSVEPLLKQVMQEMLHIEYTRQEILENNLTLEQNINYYSGINHYLINSIKRFAAVFSKDKNGQSIVLLQELKEAAGLQRAYLYSYLISDNSKQEYKEKSDQLELAQTRFIDDFFLASSHSSIIVFTKYNDPTFNTQLFNFKRDITETRLDRSHAQKWFEMSSKYINLLNNINIEILTNYKESAIKSHEEALTALYISFFLWLLSIVALVILFIILKGLIKNEEKYIDDLDSSKKMYYILSKINEAISHINELDQLYHFFTKTLFQNSSAKVVMIHLLEGNNLKYKAHGADSNQDFSTLHFPISEEHFSELTLPAKAVLENSILFNNQDETSQLKSYNLFYVFQNIKSVGAFPIINDGEVIGSLSIYAQRDIFSTEYITLVERIIDELSFAISKLNAEQSKHNLMQELKVTSHAFNAQGAMFITDDKACITRVNEAFVNTTGYTASDVLGHTPRLFKSGKHNKDFYKEMWSSITKKGSWKGEIYNKRKNGEIYPQMSTITAIKDSQGIVTNFLALFFDISNVKAAQMDAEHRADHDFLTGLMNRRSLMQRLHEEFAKAKRHNFNHAFLFIDLDHFKKVNDYHGHDVGDKLLIEVSKRLLASVRQEDIVARLSGDEFAIMLLNLELDETKAAKDIIHFLDKLVQDISTPYKVGNLTIEISGSIGIKLFPDNEKTPNDVIIHADAAMYQAKKNGKNRYAFFDHEIEEQIRYYTQMELSLQEAFEKEQFTFFYQPKVNTKTQKIEGAELLLRWQHPTKGLIFPDAFMEIAQELGYVHRFYSLALTQACKFLSTHKCTGIISINVNLHELLHTHFEHTIKEIISSYNIDPSRIELEISEENLISEFENAKPIIDELSDFGIRFGIDDFGKEYSAISYIQNLPIKSIKIDQSFFEEIDSDTNQELVKMILKIAKIYKIDTVAEGIENEANLSFLNNNKTDHYQGFYFSRAVDEEKFKEMLK